MGCENPSVKRSTLNSSPTASGTFSWMVGAIGSMVLLYMVTVTINIPQMLAYTPYMDPMGIGTV